MIMITENMVNSKLVEGNSFPLSFSSFELLRKGSRVTNQTHEIQDIENLIDFLEMDHEKDEQSCNQSQHMKKPAVCNKGLNHQDEE